MATGYPTANPAIPQNLAALEVTRMQLQQAVMLAREAQNPELAPALLVALALNKQTLQMHSDRPK